MNYQLGNLEEAVLLIALYLDEVYGVSVAEEYKKQTGQDISIPAIHTVLRRLEDKALLKSKMESRVQREVAGEKDFMKQRLTGSISSGRSRKNVFACGQRYLH